MTYTSTYVSNNNVNIISVRGKTPDIRLIPLVNKVFNENDWEKTTALLFDIRYITIENSLVELLQFFEKEIAYRSGNNGLSIALLYNNQPDVFKFIEDSGVNRGWNIKIFNNLSKGLDWLKN